MCANEAISSWMFKLLTQCTLKFIINHTGFPMTSQVNHQMNVLSRLAINNVFIAKVLIKPF